MVDNVKIRILIADDHPVFRKGLVDIISTDNRFLVVGETGDGAQVIKLVNEVTPTVLLLDLNMPGSNGLDIAESMRDLNIDTKIIVLTMHKEEAVFNRAMDLGVRGYVLKESAVNDILESIKAVVNDKYYISPMISKFLINRKNKSEAVLLENPGLKELTLSESKILKLISENKTSKEIADIMFISIRTVENHRMNICNKLRLHGSNALLKFAIENKSYL